MAYNEEEIVRARQQLDTALAAKPGAYQGQYQAQLQDTMNKILNREKFQYDLNGDALYQQYKNQAIRNGRLAMQDTMGQAAALTGGYGNSYAQQVGQQTYQNYLASLNDKVPELYKLALDQYNQEGDRLNNAYNILGQADNRDYGRYQDALAAWQADRNYYGDRYQNERTMGYQMGRDAAADSQWERQFNESVRQWQTQWDHQLEREALADAQAAEAAAAKGRGGGGGGGSRKTAADATATERPLSQTYTPSLDGAKGGLYQRVLTENQWNNESDAYLNGVTSKSAPTSFNSYKDYKRAVTEYNQGLAKAAEKARKK